MPLFCCFSLVGALAFAQGLDFSGHTGLPAGIDISGAWYPLAFQDSGLITASGALAEYGGIPLNEAGRLYALAWNPSRIQGRQHQCMGYVPPYTYNQPGNLRFWEERDPYTQRLVAIKQLLADRRRHAHDLDGRSPASARLRAAHLGRILDRQIRRQRS